MEELSRSINATVEQFNHVSLANLSVPKYDGSQDIHEFLSDYELVTLVLDDKQKIMLLGKAFISGKYDSWFKRYLRPAMNKTNPVNTWDDLKKIIIKRFSNCESTDRHLKKLERLKFDPKDNKLMDFVEEFIYSFDKVYSLAGKEAICVKTIKAKLPDEVNGQLCLMSEYREAVTIDALMKAVKQYDFNSAKLSNPSSSMKLVSDEMVSILQKLISQNESNQKQIVAAIQTRFSSQQNYRNRNKYGRAISPERSANNSRESSTDRSEKSYQNDHCREKSEKRYDRDRDRKHHYDHKPKSNSNRQNLSNNESDRESTSAELDKQISLKNKSKNSEDSAVKSRWIAYFKKYSKPEDPCSNCGEWHWWRHCPLNLNLK